MLRLIVQTKRKHKKRVKKSKEEKETMSDEEPLDEKKDNGDQDSHQDSEGETEEGYSSNTDCDKDSEVSLMNDTDEDIDTAEIEEEEEWIEYIKRSTKEMKKNESSQCPLAGSKHKEKLNGSLHTLKQDGQKKEQNGFQASALEPKHAEHSSSQKK